MSPFGEGRPTPEISQEEMGLMPTPEQQAEAKEKSKPFDKFKKKLGSALRNYRLVEAATLLAENLDNEKFAQVQKDYVVGWVNKVKKECVDIGNSTAEVRKRSLAEARNRRAEMMGIDFYEPGEEDYEKYEKSRLQLDERGLARQAEEAQKILEKATGGFTAEEAVHFKRGEEREAA